MKTKSALSYFGSDGMNSEVTNGTFTLIRFNPKRAARGVGAAEVAIHSDDLECVLWMTLRDIEANIKEFGEQPGLIAARHSYRSGAQFPPPARE